MALLFTILNILFDTLLAVVPIVAIIFGFQYLVIRRPVPHLKRVLVGLVYVVLGLALFLVGLDLALFPLGKLMAEQLTDPAFVFGAAGWTGTLDWWDYRWVYLFALTIGFSTAIAEPSLMAVAIKAHEVSGGAIGVWGLRVAVAMGVAIGITVGALRIVMGIPLHYIIAAGYTVVVIQTYYAPRTIIPLAYDSGGVATSTVTVPLVAALGLGLATTVPGRSAVSDGFGMIATAVLFPMIMVMGYAQLSHWRNRRAAGNSEGD